MPAGFDPAAIPLYEPLEEMLQYRNTRPLLGLLSLHVRQGRIVDCHVQLERCPATELEAAEAFARLRWPLGWRCPACRHEGYTVPEGRPRQRRCAACGHRRSVTSGTALHGKHDLCRWFAAAMVLGSARQGSARHFAKVWKCNPKTAWASMHLLRKLASEVYLALPEKERPTAQVFVWSKCRPDARTRLPRERNVGLERGLWSKWTHRGFVADYSTSVHTGVIDARPVKMGMKLKFWSHVSHAGVVSWQSELVTTHVNRSVSPRWAQRYRGCLVHRSNVARHGGCARTELIRLTLRSPPLPHRAVPPP